MRASPFLPSPALNRENFDTLVRRAIFDCCKWDPQLEDSPALHNAPIVLTDEAWAELGRMSEALSREILAAEHELADRPELHRALALPGAVRRVLADRARRPSAGAARLVRFDFHWTSDGWRISEANTDVPGGVNEASGLPALIADHVPNARSAGDVGAAYVNALVGGADRVMRVALVHATAYTDDHQVMEYLARRLSQRGVVPVLVSPAEIVWRESRAHVSHDGALVPIDRIVRFFPGEWLPNLARRTGWRHFVRGGSTGQSNPATALLTQSKRLPLVWDLLTTPMPTWRALLPETRDVRDAPWQSSEDWIVKPAMGRVGELIGIRGVTDDRVWKQIRRGVRWWPSHWIAQRRFDAIPVRVGDAIAFPCVGVYTVDGSAVGAYGRVALRPLTDWRARDAAVLVAAAPRIEREKHEHRMGQLT
jgi:glutathionylspermidine synthase